MPNDDKITQAVREAYRKALQIAEDESPPDTHSNSKAVVASKLTYLLLELDLENE